MVAHRQLAEEALEAGDNKFMPEKPCVNGHMALRFTKPPYACAICHATNTRNSRQGKTNKRTCRKAITSFEAEIMEAMNEN